MKPGKGMLSVLGLLALTSACSRPAVPQAEPISRTGVASTSPTMTLAPMTASSSPPAPLSPSPSPLSSSLPASAPTLQQELFFSLGGGAAVPGTQGDCLDLAPAALPAIRDSGRNTLDPLFKDYSSVCLYGFPLDQTLLVSVFRPDGSGAGSERFIYQPWMPGEPFGYLMRLGGERPGVAGDVHKQPIGPVMELLLWLPPGLPEGEWRIEVRAGGVLTSGAFTVGPRRDEPALDLAFDPPASPLSRPGIYSVSYGLDCPAYTAGQQVPLSFTHLPPDRTFPVGFYRGNKLVRRSEIVSSSQGDTTASLQILPSDPPGQYFVIAVLDLQTKAPLDAGPFACLYVPSWQPCPDAPPSRLSVGSGATVNPDVTGSGRVRARPGLSGSLVGKIEPGEFVSVLDGPACADGMVWWQVSYFVNSSDIQTGWTAEGDGKNDWLVTSR